MDQGLALAIPLLPFLGWALLGVNKRLSRSAVAFVAVGTVALSFLCGCVLFAKYASAHDPAVFTYFRWLSAGPLQVDFAFQIDRLSLLMVLIVTGVGSLIHWYATAYMAPYDHAEHGRKALDDQGYSRFFSYLNLFTALMLVLVLGANYVVMFIGWEGVGLCSYLLIGFYYDRWSATQAGKKAFLVNRVGDFCFLAGLFLLLSSDFGAQTIEGTRYLTADYQTVLANAADLMVNPNYRVREVAGALATVITLLFFLGATGKSAQIPLFVWLPDAMEGPTPVSALIHAATMVTAGVYMVVRSNLLFLMSPTTMAVIGIVAALTALLAACIAITQYDIKRVLAYSTISQLGYMFLAAGLGAFIPAIFHLMTHAFFKACLFLGSGSVIHGMEHATGSHDPKVVQDMRHMGGLAKAMPTTHWTMLVSCAAIAGFPLTAGFFSKDAILHESYLMPFVNEDLRLVLVVAGYVTAFLTALYMFRLYHLTFSGAYRGAAGHGEHGHAVESPLPMTGTLQILGILSVVAGFLFVAPVFVPFEKYLEPIVHDHMRLPLLVRENVAHPSEALWGEEALARLGLAEPFAEAPAADHAPAESEAEAGEAHATYALPQATWENSLPFYLISAVLALLGIMLAKSLWGKDPAADTTIQKQSTWLWNAAARGWRIDELYHTVFVANALRWFHGLWRGLDEAFLDDTLVEGTGRSAVWVAMRVRGLQSGFLRAYALYITLGVIGLVALTLWARAGSGG